MTTLSIVIPAYNEEQGISQIIDRIFSVRDRLMSIGLSDMELLVVDDGSRDKTREIASSKEKDLPGLHVISHPKNKGYGAALKTGFSHAHGDLLCFMDADGTYPPESLPQLCQMAMDGTDLVIGSRMAGAESQMPPMRRIGNFFFANLLSMIGCEKVTDSASGMRVFRRDVLDRMYPLPDGLNFTPVMSTRAMHEGLGIAEVPIPYSERIGRSKLSVVHDGLTFLQSIVWTALGYNPVRIFGFIGLGGVGLAMLIGLGLMIARLSGITQLNAWGVFALFVAMVSAVSGLSVFALGMTFNYLVSLFYKRTIRQGLLGKPMFKTPLYKRFGGLGIVALIVGVVTAVISLVLGSQGWDITRLWFYMVAAAMLFLMGVQFVVYWVLINVLDELSQREVKLANDLNASMDLK